MTAPLQGRRVVVTRSEEQAGSLVLGLRAHGALPLIVPSIRYHPPPDLRPLHEAARALRPRAWVVFTSGTGVAYGWGVLQEVWPGGLPDGVRLAAVGAGTAEALRTAGAPVDFVPREALGDALVAELPLEPGDRVVLLRSDIGREAIAVGLAARGADVLDVVAYRTVSEADPAVVDDALRQRPDAVTFTSPSTVRGFLAAVPDRAALADAALVVIGPVTADALTPFGLTADAVADPHTVGGLIDALHTLFA